MPRAGWLAVGGISAALAIPGTDAAVLAVAAITTVGAVAAAVRYGHAPTLAAAVGAAIVVARLVIGLAVSVPDVPMALPAGEGPWHARVLSLGSLGGGRQRAIVELRPDTRAAASDVRTATLRIYLQLPRYPVLAPGDALAFHGRLTPAPPGPGFGDHLARNRVAATAFAREVSLAAGSGGAIQGLEDLRRDAGETLLRTFPSPEGGLAAGILIGLRDQVDRDVADAFTTAGLSHVVAISGWNIALVGAVVAALLRGIPRRARAVVLLVAICAYTVAAGASPSVVRAAVMGGVVLLARESGRSGQAATALGLAAWVMLVGDPVIVHDAGYRLSVAATAGLLAWASPITALVAARVPARTPSWITESLAVSLAAQAATLPLVLVDFGRLSLIAPLSNLLVAPLVAPAMLASLLGLLAGCAVALGAPHALEPIAATAGWMTLGPIVAVARASAGLPLASIELAEPANILGAGLAGTLLLGVGTETGRRALRRVLARLRTAVSRARRRRRGAPGGPRWRLRRGAGGGAARPAVRVPRSRVARGALAAVAVAAVLLVLVAASRPDGRLHMHVLDVGQGDAILLEGPNGGRLLVDTGPDPDRLLTLLDERIPPWDRRIDVLLASHPHEDHVAGLALLLRRYHVSRVAESGMPGEGPGDSAYRTQLARLGRRAATLARGDRLTLDGTRIDVLWPPGRSVPAEAPPDGKSINNLSLVLDVRYGERRMLLTGDIEEEIDPLLLADGIAPDGRPLDVLKVAHHGSRTATTPSFLAALRPRVAVISAGADNDYGHPSPATIARLHEAGARTYRTDTDGTITITTDGRDVSVTTSGRRVAPARRRAGPTADGSLADAPPRIARWPSRRAAMPRGSSPSSIPRPGSSGTSRRSRRSPRSLRRVCTHEASPWIARSWRAPRCSTTSTSCSPRAGRSRVSDTAMPGLGGSRSAATPSSRERSPPIRCRA